ncbi:hypothetical protein [Actinophytocola oryzae]|uniref:Uncharacterized protein n=1 Tax=Actinophytocola oryzae TaxID=502181 RepID=A0A4R7VI39_9PSEU|nr:hypothetical protein [Actinophytocola oryzae]TDV48845.1 hypothetical protein CLV71_108205 [Actinophytocola oryzae]
MPNENEGLGTLAKGLLFVFMVVGAVGGGALGQSIGGERTGLLLGAGVGLVLVGFAYYPIARAANSTVTPTGRRWHNLNTIRGVPIQRYAAFNPGLGVAAIAGAIGRATSAWLGFLFFLVAFVAAVVFYRRFHTRRLVAGLTARREYASAHGHEYRDRELNLLGDRWNGIYPNRTVVLQPFGVVAGETDGLPWTVFDSMQLSADGRRVGLPGAERARRTVWVVHLPVAYPRLRLIHDSAPSFVSAAKRREAAAVARLEAEPAAQDFANAAAAAGALELTEERGLPDWWLEGRDLITAAPAPDDDVPIPPERLVGTLDSLLALARVLTTAPLGHHGTRPTTDVPLRAEVRQA